MKVTILGCGGSQGVPTATGDWGVCDPKNPRNWRRRPAALVETATPEGEPRTILIDTPPELREQLVRAEVRRIDAVLFTHSHADHLHGIDDLRSFASFGRQRISVYAEPTVGAEIRRRFGYVVSADEAGMYRPTVTLEPIAGLFEAAGVPVVPFAQDHGFGPSTGFRIGEFAYSIDVVRLDERAFQILHGVTLWVVDCQQIEPHPTHSHLTQTLEWIDRVGARRAILTHMGLKLDYDSLSRRLPARVEPGYDGLVLEF